MGASTRINRPRNKSLVKTLLQEVRDYIGRRKKFCVLELKINFGIGGD